MRIMLCLIGFSSDAINVSLTPYPYTLHRGFPTTSKYVKETTSHVYSLLYQAHIASRNTSFPDDRPAARPDAICIAGAAHAYPGDRRRRLAAYYLRLRIPDQWQPQRGYRTFWHRLHGFRRRDCVRQFWQCEGLSQ